MKSYCIIISPTCALILYVLVSLSSIPGRSLITPSEEGQSEPPELFDFDRFKMIFGKDYSTPSEALMRNKLFLGRSLLVYLSWVAFKNRSAPSYLRVNKYSDETPSELARMYGLRRKNKTPEASAQLWNHNEQANDAIAGEAKSCVLKASKNTFRLGERLNFKGEVPPTELGRSEVDSDLTNESKPGQSLLMNDGKGNDVTEIDRSKIEVDSFSSDESAGGRTLRLRSGKSIRVSKKQLASGTPTIDHRTGGCIPAIRDQGTKCGSCYVFSTLSYYSWLMCSKFGQLSEQYIIDCGRRANLKGCDGGDESEVAKFISVYGLELGDDYPYLGRESSCPYPVNTNPHKMGNLRVNNDRLIEIKLDQFEEYLMAGPILAGISAGPSFPFYGGGIADCKKEDSIGDHAMLLVGQGRHAKSGKKYWLFHNSYGKDFGPPGANSGYYKLDKESDCVLDTGYVSSCLETEKPFAWPNKLNTGSAVRRKSEKYDEDDDDDQD